MLCNFGGKLIHTKLHNMDRQGSFPGAPYYYHDYNQFNPQMHQQMNPYPAYHGADISMHYNPPTQPQQSRPISPASSLSSHNEDSLLGAESQLTSSGNKKAASGSKKKREYDTWNHQQQKLLIQLWAENHEWLESKDSRKTWRKICDELNSRLTDSNKTVEKCMKKIKYLIEKYKVAKEWNRKQSGGHMRKSIWYDEIDAVLGCRDIVTLSHVSEAGSSASSSAALNTSNNSSASADDNDNNTGSTNSPRSEASNSEEAKKGQRKDRKKARKRPHRDTGEDEDDTEYSESLKCFKETGEKLGSFMDNFADMQKQQMNMMGQFVGAMTQFMAKSSDNSS